MLTQVYGEDSYFQYFPLLLYSVVPIIASTLYTFLAKALNDFEDHDTAVRKKNMLVIKVSGCYNSCQIVNGRRVIKRIPGYVFGGTCELHA